MKAHILYGVGDLQYADVPEPELKPEEVLVNVKACGICGSDIARVFKTGTYHFPTIIGHEFAGIVVKVHDESQAHLLGKRVGVFPLKPCFECHNCKDGKYELCTDYDYLGSRCDGGFGEYVAVPQWNLIELPDNVEFTTAALLEPTSVAMHGLTQASFRQGDTIAVVGPGTIGIIMCRLAQILGAGKVILIGRNQQKLDFARNYGIENVINSSTDDVIRTIMFLSGGKGVDIAVEGTGASASMNMCLDISRYSGSILALGNPVGDMQLDKTSYWKLLRHQLKIYGTWNSRFGTTDSDWTKILSLLTDKRLELEPLITHKLDFDKLSLGLDIMQDNTVYSNKVMLVNL